MIELHIRPSKPDGPRERLVLHCENNGPFSLTVELWDDSVDFQTTEGSVVSLDRDAVALLAKKLGGDPSKPGWVARALEDDDE